MKLVKFFSIAAAGLMLVAACGSPRAEGSQEVRDLLPSQGQIDTTSYLLGVNFGLVILFGVFCVSIQIVNFSVLVL